MRILLTAFAAIVFCSAFAQEDYTITLNDSTFNISLDQSYLVNINGKRVSIVVKSKDTLSYINPLFSFQYSKEFKVTDVSVDKNVTQLLLMDASGSGFLIQGYKNLNPEKLTELLVDQATKENNANGYDLNRSEYERTLISGQQVKVIKLVQRYKDNVRTYEVMTYGKKDEGAAVLTFNMPINPDKKGKDIVTLMWQTLSVE